ncbi:MAG: DUF1577 domain-containing protein [Spirochaetia bacterium]|nr:DUF1577 domain-containing protein [Spirochaetia bacterium]
MPEILNCLSEAQRQFSVVDTPEKIDYLFNKYLVKNGLYFKNSIPPVEAVLTGYERGILNIRIPTRFNIEEKFILFTNIKKQLEIECNNIEKISNEQVKAVVTKINIAEKDRVEIRIKPTTENAVFANNFLISKNKIELNFQAYSISNKVIFKEFEKEISIKYNNSTIKDIDPADLSFETKLIKTKKTGVFIKDINQDETFIPPREDLLNLKEIFNKEELNKNLRLIKEKGIKSFILYPILYTTIGSDKIPIGYIYLKSNEKSLDLSDYDSLGEVSERIIDRIKDANMINININQKIINISKKGLLIEVENNELKKYLINRKDLTFDVVFRLQQPLRFYGLIKHIREKNNNNLLVGIEFSGFVHQDKLSTNSVKKRLDENLTYLTNQYT